MCVCVCLCVFTQQNCLSAKINQPTATPWGWGSSRRDHDLHEASLALLRAAVPSSMATVAQTTGSCPATTGVPDFKSFLNFSRDCSMVMEKKKVGRGAGRLLGLWSEWRALDISSWAACFRCQRALLGKPNMTKRFCSLLPPVTG